MCSSSALSYEAPLFLNTCAEINMYWLTVVFSLILGLKTANSWDFVAKYLILTNINKYLQIFTNIYKYLKIIEINWKYFQIFSMGKPLHLPNAQNFKCSSSWHSFRSIIVSGSSSCCATLPRAAMCVPSNSVIDHFITNKFRFLKERI